MLKVMKAPLMVSFYNRSREMVTGDLLLYEMVGEACVQVKGEKIWIPFSRLTQRSQKRVLKPEQKKEKTASTWDDSRVGIIFTLLVIMGYLQFGI